MHRAAVAVVVLLAFGSCRGSEEKEATPPADRPSSTSTTGAAPSTTVTGPPEGDPGAAPIALRPDGIGAFAFGVPDAPVRAALTQAFGAPESDDALPAGSCSGGATRSVSWGDLHVLFGPDEGGKPTLYGWTYGTDDPPATPAVATGEGITVGSTRDELQAAYGAKVNVTEDETVGAVRFTVEGSRYQLALSGLLTGPAGTDKVRALFAGSYCGE